MRSLQEYVKILKKEGELIEITKSVSTDLEITEFADRMSKSENGGKALLFTNTGYNFPVLINHFGSDKRVLLALGLTDYDEPSRRIDELVFKLINIGNKGFFSKLGLLGELKKISTYLPKKLKSKGSCQEVINMDPNLDDIPVLQCWPYDGGKFITLPLVISEDPETGMNNIGMYRLQIFDSKTTGMHWHMHKGGAAHFEKYKKLKKRMPISVVLGGDPVLTYCATAPMPENIDEYILAGFLLNEPIKLVKCITNDLYVPENADFVIEGYIDPGEEFRLEGPFGDHTGFYSLTDKYPVLHVTCITRKNEAIYPATIVGIPPMEDFYLGKATENIFLKPIQLTIASELADIRLPAYGVAHNLVILKAVVRYRGQSMKIMNSLLGAGQMMFSKIMCCFDEDVDIYNDKLLINYFAQVEDIYRRTKLSCGPADVLDHSAYEFAYGGKLLFDMTGFKISNYILMDIEDIIHNDLEDIIYFGKMAFSLVEDENLKVKKYIEDKWTYFVNSNIIILVDKLNFDKTKPFIFFWYLLNNFDPLNDCYFLNNKIVIDGRRKHFKRDGFNREWPNVICMTDEVIERVDNKWENYTSMQFISSPSKSIKFLVHNEGAVATED